MESMGDKPTDEIQEVVDNGNRLRIYLDNCCYNRPFDEQSEQRVWEESQAKIKIQTRIKTYEYELASSYTLRYEYSRIKDDSKRNYINSFVEENTEVYVDESYKDELDDIAAKIMATGVKMHDAYHVASAIAAQCDYFLTTDDRLLKYQDDRIKITTPDEFLRLEG